MAVLDYVPAGRQQGKTPSGRAEWTVRLVRTPKVIRHIREWLPDVLLVQFKLEVDVADEQLREIAMASLARNRSDLVVANDLARIGRDAHPALVLDAAGGILARPSTKAEIAESLCEILDERL
jgi:phosphopantothenate-cysteine ligase